MNLKTVFSIFIKPRMWVCVCKAVTDQQVRECIANGAETREAVTKACEAGGDCGACHEKIEEMIDDHLIAVGRLGRGRAA